MAKFFDAQNPPEVIRWAKVNALQPDYQKYPLFNQARYYESYLEPGQVLYLPNQWWHTVESRDISISISADLDGDRTSGRSEDG